MKGKAAVPSDYRVNDVAFSLQLQFHCKHNTRLDAGLDGKI